MTIYTILSEFRSGGFTLGEWIAKNEKDFIFAHEPWSDWNKIYTESLDPSETDWIEKIEKNLVIKELWSENEDYSELIRKSSKVICLYRENWYEQIRSFLYAKKTERWHNIFYDIKDIEKNISEEELKKCMEDHNFLKYKSKFQSWISKENLFSISYEDLYYRGGNKKNHRLPRHR